MATDSKIQWTHHTFNAWRGCTKVSPGCAHCYAERQAKRNPKVLGQWGPGAPRVEAAESYWKLPERWFKEARRFNLRFRVFTNSLADVFDEEAPFEAQRRLFTTIAQTSGHIQGPQLGGLDWLILTKRPQNIGPTLAKHGMSLRFFLANGVWLGVSVESQEYLKRFWIVEHWSHRPWISAEPLLGPLEMPNVLERCKWVVVGGESGPLSRPCELQWIKSIIRQCSHFKVPVFVKQLGSAASDATNGIAGKMLAVPDEATGLISFRLTDSKGGDTAEWPHELQKREYPNPITPCNWKY